ncbi:MAG: hypothetical protein ACFFCX_17075 [Candidatus Sifarchaeia archaeon]
MKWSKQLYSVLVISMILIVTSVNSTFSIITRFENSSDQEIIVNSTLDLENFVQSSVNETIAYGSPTVPYVYWGWVGNLSFTYWDATKDVGIPGANVSCYIDFMSLDYFDLGNGTYLVEVNTTYLWLETWFYLFVSFDKTGFENQVVVTPIIVQGVHTNLVVFSPEVNQLSTHPLELVVPLGDSLEIMFFYNDTDNSDGYVGGLEGAQAYVRIVGPTLVEHFIELVDFGEGYYNLTFDTNLDWLYESVGGVPTSHELPFLLDISFALENRYSQEVMIEITIIDIPTELELTPALEITQAEIDLTIFAGQYSLFVSLVDIWPTHDGLPVQDVNITVESSDPNLLEVLSITEDYSEPGVYNITLNHKVPDSAPGGCDPVIYASVDLSISIGKNGYESQNLEINVGLLSSGGLPIWSSHLYGLPIVILVFLVVGVLSFRKKRRMRGMEDIPRNE